MTFAARMSYALWGCLVNDYRSFRILGFLSYLQTIQVFS
jgi:hypothetical protein